MSRQLRVADVLSDERILINAGRDDSIELGDEFLVYECGPEIKDPETKEPLGHLEIKKGQFVAIDVQPRLTIASLTRRTVTKRRRIPSGLDAIWGLRYEQYEVDQSTPVKMETSDATYTDRLVIRKNDLVRKTQRK